jgi:hypothetical protein
MRLECRSREYHQAYRLELSAAILRYQEQELLRQIVVVVAQECSVQEFAASEEVQRQAY